MNSADSAENNTFRKTFVIRGRDFDRAGSVATGIKSILKQIGFPRQALRRAAIAAYEAEMNVVMYAEHGTLVLEVAPGGVRIDLTDEGQGIEDIERAMEEGFSTAPKEFRDMGFGAGMGLPNIRKNADRFHIESRCGVGTTISIFIGAC